MLTGKYWSVNQYVEVDFKYARFIDIASTTEPVTTSTSEKPKSGMVEHLLVKVDFITLTF